MFMAYLIKEKMLAPVSDSVAYASIIIFGALLSLGLILYGRSLTFPEANLALVKRPAHKTIPFVKIERPKPPEVSMDKMKTRGCVADGLLSEYNPDWDRFAALVNRSECYYLHRAVETWLNPPDFNTINFQMTQIKKKEIVYGMFIAEAIDRDAVYYNEEEQRYFNFSEMCRDGSKDAWGIHTCKPDMANEEYRDYLDYITRKAIDLGIQSFTFGQIYMQEGSDGEDYAPKIIEKIRKYAKKKGVDVVIGAQTGSITDKKYLDNFDYIEGGVGLNSSGEIENGPCFSRRGGCWALLWNKVFSSKVKNVFLHLDWSGILSDDLDIFARMSQEKRATTLTSLYAYFKEKNMGFLMPLFGVLDPENGGCRGPKKKFYSADMAYSCQDEKAINDILNGAK